MTETERKVVDGYVTHLIERYNKEFGLKINPCCPTRESKLELALKLDEKGDHESMWSAMEIMVGRRVDSTEMTYAMLYFTYRKDLMTKEQFYGGFPE